MWLSHHNERDCALNNWHLDCLLNRLSKLRWKTASKFRVTGLCEGNSPVTGELSAQMASNTENASISWRHHVFLVIHTRDHKCPAVSTNQTCIQNLQLDYFRRRKRWIQDVVISSTMFKCDFVKKQNIDVIMSAMASESTGFPTVCSTVCSKHCVTGLCDGNPQVNLHK